MNTALTPARTPDEVINGTIHLVLRLNGSGPRGSGVAVDEGRPRVDAVMDVEIVERTVELPEGD